MDTNPLKLLREASGLSMDALAERAGCSRSFIVRAEQGCYTEPPVVLVDELLALTPVGFEGPNGEPLGDYLYIFRAYTKWQTERRSISYGRLLTSFDFESLSTLTHPFVGWRLESGIEARIEVSKLYCVHPAIIFKYEAGNILATPGDLRAALLESGYSSELLDSLDRSYYAYKDRLRKRTLDASRAPF